MPRRAEHGGGDHRCDAERDREDDRDGGVNRCRATFREHLGGAAAEHVVERVVPEAHPVLGGLDEAEGVVLRREERRLAERESRVSERTAQPVGRGVGEVSRHVEVEPPLAREPRLRAREVGRADEEDASWAQESPRRLERAGGFGKVLDDVPHEHRVEVAVGPGGRGVGAGRTSMPSTSRACAEDRSWSSVPCTSQPRRRNASRRNPRPQPMSSTRPGPPTSRSTARARARRGGAAAPRRRRGSVARRGRPVVGRRVVLGGAPGVGQGNRAREPAGVAAPDLERVARDVVTRLEEARTGRVWMSAGRHRRGTLRAGTRGGQLRESSASAGPPVMRGPGVRRPNRKLLAFAE